MALDDTLPADGPEDAGESLEAGVVTGDVDATLVGPDRTPRLANEGAIPERIGPYVPIRRLGAGAMGVVVEAYDERLDRSVALKLLRGTGRPGERLRLRREAQALAQLSHPHVVQVFEVGELGASAYLVMELCEGESLDRWLAAEPRGPAEILAVFLQAGEGLAAAHDAGLVHRDFKPGNVLVGVDGRVRVVDFGLARLGTDPPSELPSEHDEASAASSSLPSRVWAQELTRTGAMMGTPAYMSPEQLSSEPVTASSDQFSFCVALYEALYGQHPFVEQRRWNELVHNVVHGRLRPPPERSDVPARVRRAVLRGLSHDPAARWPAMDELLQALRGATRRPAWSRPAAAAVAMGAVLGGVAWLLGERGGAPEQPCSAAEAKLAEVWNPGRRAAVEQAFLATGQPYAAQTWERVGPRLDQLGEEWRSAYATACEAGGTDALDRRMACLERVRGALGAQVEVFLAADAAAVEQAVAATQGLRPAEACLRADSDEPVAPADSELAARLDAIVRALTRIEALERSGAYAAALPLAEQAVADAAAAEQPALEGRALLVLAQIEDGLGTDVQAGQRLERAYFLGLQLGSDALAGEAAVGLVSLVGVAQQDYERGLEWARHAEAEVERGGDELLRAEYLGNLGLLLTQRGDYEQALTTLEESLAVFRSVLEPGDLQVADGLTRIGIVLRKLDDDPAAARHHEQALAIYEDVLGADHPEVARVLHNLSAAQFRSGRKEEAVRALRRAVGIWERALGTDHVSLAPSYVNLSVMLGELSRQDEAEQAARRAIEILERSGTQPHTLGAALVGLATAQHRRERYEDAARSHRRAVAQLEAMGLHDHPDLALELTNFGDTLERLHQLDEAEAVLRRALAIYERTPEPPLRSILAVHTLLAEVSLDQGRYEDAVAHAERRLALEPDPPEPGRVASVRFLLARARVGMGGHARDQALEDARAAEQAAAELPPGEREDRLRRELRAWRVEHDPEAGSAKPQTSRGG